ncbi:hypothetical protein KUCAC02_022252, partial [Chaenocephalus aceratus]
MQLVKEACRPETAKESANLCVFRPAITGNDSRGGDKSDAESSAAEVEVEVKACREEVFRISDHFSRHTALLYTNPSTEPRGRRETEVETGESMRMVQDKAALMQTRSGVFLLASLRLWERN